MRPAFFFPLAALSLIQPGCGAQAQRAVAQAALFTAIEVAGAAMQAAADSAAEREANQRSRLRATPTGNWTLVRAPDDDNVTDEDSECERTDDTSNLDCQIPEDSTQSEHTESSPASLVAEQPVSVGGCIVCE